MQARGWLNPMLIGKPSEIDNKSTTVGKARPGRLASRIPG